MTPEEQNKRFAGLLKLTTEDNVSKPASNTATPSNDAIDREQTAQPSTTATEPAKPAQKHSQTAPEAPKQPKTRKSTSKAATPPDAAPERINAAIGPNSAVYQAVQEARAGMPAGMQSTSLTKYLRGFLTENDEVIAKMIREHFEV